MRTTIEVSTLRQLCLSSATRIHEYPVRCCDWWALCLTAPCLNANVDYEEGCFVSRLKGLWLIVYNRLTTLSGPFCYMEFRGVLARDVGIWPHPGSTMLIFFVGPIIFSNHLILFLLFGGLLSYNCHKSHLFNQPLHATLENGEQVQWLYTLVTNSNCKQWLQNVIAKSYCKHCFQTAIADIDCY